MVEIVSNGQNDVGLLKHAVDLLSGVAFSTRGGIEAIIAAGGVPALVRRSDDAFLQQSATLTLANNVGNAADVDAAANAAAAAGAVTAAVELLGSDSALNAEHSAILLCNLAAGSSSRQQAIRAAGGVAALTRCLQHGSTDAVQAAALMALAAWTSPERSQPERSQAIATAGDLFAWVDGILPSPLSLRSCLT